MKPTKDLITTVKDKRRGCGWRKEGGIYLRADGFSVPCGRMPIPLETCPCCGAGVKQKIGWQWFDPHPFVKQTACTLGGMQCDACVMGGKIPERAGLIWVGGCFYKTPDEFQKEALMLGISRRVHALPKGFEIGKTWVFVAHKNVIEKACPNCADGTNEEKCKKCAGTKKIKTPAIFHAFQPDRVEYVVTGKETRKDLEKLITGGITPVKVERIGDTMDMEID